MVTLVEQLQGALTNLLRVHDVSQENAYIPMSSAGRVEQMPGKILSCIQLESGYGLFALSGVSYHTLKTGGISKVRPCYLTVYMLKIEHPDLKSQLA